MEGKPVEKSFKDIFKGGVYKNFSSLESVVVKPTEIFKANKIKPSQQFSFRINPMEWHDKEAAVDTRNSYIAATNWHTALTKLGKTEKDLFPTGELDFEKANMDLWVELAPYMENNAMSKKYFQVVYDTVLNYTDCIILPKGKEESIQENIIYLSQEKQIMQFLFNKIIENSTLTPEEEDAAK